MQRTWLGPKTSWAKGLGRLAQGLGKGLARALAKGLARGLGERACQLWPPQPRPGDFLWCVIGRGTYNARGFGVGLGQGLGPRAYKGLGQGLTKGLRHPAPRACQGLGERPWAKGLQHGLAKGLQQGHLHVHGQRIQVYPVHINCLESNTWLSIVDPPQGGRERRMMYGPRTSLATSACLLLFLACFCWRCKLAGT